MQHNAPILSLPLSAWKRNENMRSLPISTGWIKIEFGCIFNPWERVSDYFAVGKSSTLCQAAMKIMARSALTVSHLFHRCETNLRTCAGTISKPWLEEFCSSESHHADSTKILGQWQGHEDNFLSAERSVHILIESYGRNCLRRRIRAWAEPRDGISTYARSIWEHG